MNFHFRPFFCSIGFHFIHLPTKQSARRQRESLMHVVITTFSMLYGKIVPREHVFALDFHYPEGLLVQSNPGNSTLYNSNLPLTRGISLQIIFYIFLPSITRTFFYFPWRFELSVVDCTYIFWPQKFSFKLPIVLKTDFERRDNAL